MTEHVRLTCPQCRAVLRVKPDARPETKLTCQNCGRELTARDAQEAPTRIAEPPEPSPEERKAPFFAEPVLETATLPGGRHEVEPSGAPEASLGRYVVQGLIGRGGMGEVLLCLDPETRRQVALKRMLPTTASDPERRERFVEEAQVTAQLEHPNIVPVYELSRDPNQNAYYTMRVVKGRSLGALLRDDAGPPPLGELLETFLKVCDAVGFAHSKGVIHRDLKPDNVMVGDFGQVLLMDWGLVKVLGREDIQPRTGVTSSRADSGTAVTVDGMTVGTPAYMSPEQAAGRIDQVDSRSDIYSLGAILYETLTLARPVQEPSAMATLEKVAEGQIVPPEQRAPSRAIPRELSAIAMKCLAKAPEARYQFVADLRADVSRFIEGRSVSAAPDTFAQALVKLVKRNKGVTASIAAAAAILVVVTAFFLVNLTRERDDAVRARALAEAQRRAAEEAGRKERVSALRASQVFAEQALRAANLGQVEEAELRVTQADEAASNSPWGAYVRGVFALRREPPDFEAAESFFRQALKADPQHAESQENLLETTSKLKSLRRAEQLLAQVAKMADSRALLALGRTLAEAGRWEDCQIPLGRAIELIEKEAITTKTPEAAAELGAQLDAARYALDDARAKLACAGFDMLVRKLPANEQVRKVRAKLTEIHGVEVEVGRREDAGSKEDQDKPWLEANLAQQVQRSVRFLYPFQGLPLRTLNIRGTGVKDLAQLKGLPLAWLDCSDTPVSDLAPLKTLPLRSLFILCDHVTDLTPLEGMGLEELCFRPRNIRKGIEAIRGMTSLKRIGESWDKLLSPAEFWQKFDAGAFAK